MAKATGTDLVFKLDTQAGSLKDITSYVAGVKGLPGKKELSDISTAGTSGYKWYPGRYRGTFTVEAIYDNATDSAYDVVKNYYSDTATRSFEFGPAGSTAGLPKYSGECRISDVQTPTDVGQVNRLTITCEVDGDITISTWT